MYYIPFRIPIPGSFYEAEADISGRSFRLEDSKFCGIDFGLRAREKIFGIRSFKSHDCLHPVQGREIHSGSLSNGTQCGKAM